MSVAQAAELLGVLPGTPAHEVKRRYHKIYNDYQVRLTNAPTPSLKRLYQRNLQEVQAAAELLSPGVVREGRRRSHLLRRITPAAKRAGGHDP